MYKVIRQMGKSFLPSPSAINAMAPKFTHALDGEHFG